MRFGDLSARPARPKTSSNVHGVCQMVPSFTTMLWLLSLSAVLGASGCQSATQKLNEAALKARTASLLGALTSEVNSVIILKKKEPPLEEKAFCIWVKGNIPSILSRLTIIDGLIVDAWGRPLKLVIANGRVVRIVSLGPNGKWDNCSTDDIPGPMVKREESRRR